MLEPREFARDSIVSAITRHITVVDKDDRKQESATEHSTKSLFVPKPVENRLWTKMLL